MKALIVFILSIVSTTLFSQDTLTIYYDKDWNEIQDKQHAVFYRKAFLNTDKLWSVRDYYISNKIQMTGTYTSKKFESRTGHFVFFHENGNRESEGQFLKNKKEGTWKDWYENGQQKFVGSFINDHPNGSWVYWFEDGQKQAEGCYLNNVKEGKWIYWYSGGKIKCEEVYQRGSELLCKTVGYHENGVLSYKGGLVNGTRQGEWAFYNGDGKVYLQGMFNRGSMEGVWIRYLCEGNMKLNYKLGKYQGNPLGGIAGRP